MNEWGRKMDIGRFTGFYFQVLALMAILDMVLALFSITQGAFDLNIILYLWAGHSLKKHEPVARKWVIGGCLFIIGIEIIFLAVAAIAGTQNVTVMLGHRIQNPTFIQVIEAAGIITGIAAIPCVLLLTQKARQEFTSPIAKA
jgi:hypothetical protein